MTRTVTIEERPFGVAWVTINRPEVMNALSGEVLEELVATAATVADERSIRLVAITGAGDKAFSAGADLKERRGMTDEQTRARLELINRAFNAWSRLPQPTVAVVNGVAFGGGLELALACDLRYAAAGAKLGLTEVRLGIMPGAGGTQRLPRIVGAARAKELILFGRRIDALEAERIGLVAKVMAADALGAAVEALAVELAGCAPVSVAQAKAAIDRGQDLDLDAGLDWERRCYDVTLATEDRNEGLAAFAAKRPPNFRGK